MKVRIKPSHLKGDVVVPPSKSLAHRAIIAASLAHGKSVISNIEYSEDIKATINAMKSLGVSINELENSLEIIGCFPKLKNKVIDANESGSTLRFLIPIALLTNEELTFVGKGKLPKRPLDLYFEIFEEQGIEFSHDDDYLPLKVKGSLKSGNYNIRGDVSSQFITGLLYTLPLLNGDSTITITTKLESKGYIDLTLDVLKSFGIKIEFKDNIFFVKGNQEYTSRDYTVEGDFSQAAFWLVADMLGAEVNLKGMNLDSSQGDKKIIEDIVSFGGKIVESAGGIMAKALKPCGTTISFAQSPDLGPALSVLASVIPGESHFIDAGRLRIKECDRISAVREELLKLGANITEFSSGMDFKSALLHGGEVSSHNDHRLAMAFSMISLVIKEDLVISTAEAINKSYPRFFDDFKSLGGKISYE